MAMRVLPAVVVLLLTAACGGGEPAAAPPSPTPVTAATPSPTAAPDPSPSPEPVPSPTASPADAAKSPAAEDPAGAGGSGSGVQPAGQLGMATIEDADFPSGGGDTAYLTDVRVGAHDGFDRVVLEFRGSSPPSHRVGYLDPPVLDDGSGAPVAVAGDAFLELRMTPASGVDLSTVDLEQTYSGPARIKGGGTGVVAEVVRTGDFEATLTWVVGLERRAPFTAVWLRDPLRLVVDVASG